MNGEPTSYRNQMIGSLLVALAIIAIAILAVTARLGTTSVAEEEARNERLRERLELREERIEQRREAIERAADRP
jgi:type II secretory pathway pseudopilin PulG